MSYTKAYGISNVSQTPDWRETILAALISFAALTIAQFYQGGVINNFTANRGDPPADTLQQRAISKLNKHSQSGGAIEKFDGYSTGGSLYHFSNFKGDITWI